MNNISLDFLLSECKSGGHDLNGVMTSVENIFFEERVKMNCFYCGKYGKVWKCPPKIPELNYKKMLNEFNNIAFIYIKKKFGKSDFPEVRQTSSVELHRGLLACEKLLYEHNFPMAISFIGGSCKLCKNGCATDHCANPYQARTPVEAMGINVIESAKKVGIEIVFPPAEYIMRIGLLCW